MKRRHFIGIAGMTSGIISTSPISLFAEEIFTGHSKEKYRKGSNEIYADLVIVGAGLGGFACVLTALRNGLSVVLTEAPRPDGGTG